MMLCFYLLLYSLFSVTSSDLLSRQRRSWIINSFSIEEGNPGPFPYVLGKIDIDRRYRVYYDLFGEGVDEEPKGVLSIHKESGTVSVHKALDYEHKTYLKLKFEARRPDLSLDTKLGVEIDILDINDNAPLFQKDVYEFSIGEEQAQGSHLMTVQAYDRDRAGSPNSTFHYEMKSVSPNPPDVEFFLDEFGVLSFKGCLDFEISDKYTLLVEAKDHGDVVQLSSSTTVLIHIQDGNNHLPAFSGQTGSGKVKEGETGSSPLRLHVTDKDTLNSPAWRAKYTIHGDKGEHFKIETDPDTNDGILTVVKPLDFEEGAKRELSISVENEAPYFSCKVKERTSSGLWEVDTSGGDGSSGVPLTQPDSVKVIVQVEDTNDPPMFTVAVKETVLEENADIGTLVETVTAVDPDASHARDFVYEIGHDPDGWVTVDPNTGSITTAKILDRESPHVVNNVYTIILHAVDNGEPPMTGTATLLIHVQDQNDNVPQLTVNSVDVCVSDDPSTTNITAFDLDDEPFGGPFRFELQGDVTGKWSLDPSYGHTVNLVKTPSVYAGPHTVELKISDMQGQFAIYNLSVTACDCSVTPNCRGSRSMASQVGYGAVGMVFASLFVLLFLLLLAIFISCKKDFSALQIDSTYGETLLSSNTEKLGTDCKVPLTRPLTKTTDNYEQKDLSHWHRLGESMQHTDYSTKVTNQTFSYQDVTDFRMEKHLFNGNSINKMISQSVINHGCHHNHQARGRSTLQSLYNRNSSLVSDAALLALLHQRLLSLQASDEALEDYKPHLYADEGDSGTLSELEDISIPDDPLDLKELQDLGPQFRELASICKPPHIQN